MTLMNSGDASIMIWQSLYYLIYKDWWVLHYSGFAISVILIAIISMFIPESPKFYYANKRFQEARDQLLYIAQFNGTKISALRI